MPFRTHSHVGDGDGKLQYSVPDNVGKDTKSAASIENTEGRFMPKTSDALNDTRLRTSPNTMVTVNYTWQARPSTQRPLLTACPHFSRHTSLSGIAEFQYSSVVNALLVHLQVGEHTVSFFQTPNDVISLHESGLSGNLVLNFWKQCKLSEFRMLECDSELAKLQETCE